MNAETLLSNMTGYVGICLGFCLLQIPPFFEEMLKSLNKVINKKKNKVSNFNEDEPKKTIGW